MNLGIDLGSTYTILSTYRNDHKKLEALEVDSNGMVNIPSVISLKKDNVRYGTFAKEQTGKKNVNTYKAFKMLLMEQNKEFVKHRGYDEVHSPQWAMQEFLRCVIQKAQTWSTNEDSQGKIGELVVGAPDVWFHSFNTLATRSVIEKYCKQIEGVENVRIISEPVLASAYFAYNYQKKKDKPYEGDILIIDYGGGTLDLSLTHVKKGKEQNMEIKLIESNGAGENTDHSVGNAGIIYMESLMEHILRKNNPDQADEIIGTQAFYKAVNNLETILLLKDVSDSIKEAFDTCGISYLDDLEEEVIEESIECEGEEYEVTCADLVRVYNKVIRDTFEQKMDEMIELALEHGIDLRIPNVADLKIALVGGFGNFYLVRNQMYSKFRISSDDLRTKDIIDNPSDCERAISYGAALIAGGIIGISSTAPYSFGIRYEDYSGKECVGYMVRNKQDIKIDGTIYELKAVDGATKYLMLANGGLKNDFVIDHGRHGSSNIYFKVREERQNDFTELVSEENLLKTCSVGVSFNASSVPTLYVKEYDTINGVPGNEKLILLDDFHNLFVERSN